MTTTSTENDFTSLVKQGCFVQLHFARPTLRTKLTWGELGHAQLDNVVSAPSTRPPSKAYNEFGKLESRARALLATYTTGRRGLRFMRFNRYTEFVDLVQPILDAYEAHIEPFLAGWEETVDAALGEWEERAGVIYDELSEEHRAKLGSRDEFKRRLVNRLRRSWPGADELRSRFDAELEVQQFAFSGGSEMSEADMLALDPKVVKDMKRRAEESFQKFLNESMIELRERAIEIVRRMHGVLVKGETVTERSINPLREFAKQFKELQVVPDDEFQQRLEGLVTTIDRHGGAEGLRGSTDAWLEVQGMLGEVADQGEALVAEAVKQGMGPGKRSIKL